MLKIEDSANHSKESPPSSQLGGGNEVITRRSFLVASTLSTVLFSNQMLHGEERKKKRKAPAYTRLSDEDGRKVLSYSAMVQGLQAQNILLTQTFHPEDKLDNSREQQALFAKGEPFEFSEGYLYHGRGNLGQILSTNSLPKNSFVTRVPQTWALQPFVDQEADPAIFVLDALDFNRLQNDDKADLYLDVVRSEFGQHIAEPYPSLTEELPIDKCLQILIEERTYEKFQTLVREWEAQSPNLSPEQRITAERFKLLLDAGKVQFFTVADEAESKNITKSERFMELRKKLETHLKLYRMTGFMPLFRRRTDKSTGPDDKTPAPISTSEAAKKLRTDLKKVVEMIEDEQVRQQQEKVDNKRKEQIDFWKKLGFGTTALAGLIAFLSWVGHELGKALSEQQGNLTMNESSSIKSDKPAMNGKKRSRKH